MLGRKAADYLWRDHCPGWSANSNYLRATSCCPPSLFPFCCPQFPETPNARGNVFAPEGKSAQMTNRMCWSMPFGWPPPNGRSFPAPNWTSGDGPSGIICVGLEEILSGWGAVRNYTPARITCAPEKITKWTRSRPVGKVATSIALTHPTPVMGWRLPNPAHHCSPAELALIPLCTASGGWWPSQCHFGWPLLLFIPYSRRSIRECKLACPFTTNPPVNEDNGHPMGGASICAHCVALPLSALAIMHFGHLAAGFGAEWVLHVGLDRLRSH